MLDRAARCKNARHLRPDALVLIEKFDAGLIRAGPAYFPVKTQFFAFNFKDDLCVLLQVFGFGCNPAATGTDILDDTRLVNLLEPEDPGPLAVLPGEDPGFLQQFLHR